jgi:O-succinylbenzoate synthase
MEQTTAFAIQDALARNARYSLFRDLTIPPSHASLPDGIGLGIADVAAELDRISSDGFDLVKMKGGNDPDSEADLLGRLGPEFRLRNLKLRLDLNAKLDVAETAEMLEKLRAGADGLDWIDWVEDPCAFDVAAWRTLRDSFGVRLAFDLAGNPSAKELAEAASVIVVKPALRNAEVYSSLVGWSALPICVTSYLDHPVGQAFAAWFAASKQIRNAEYLTCGLLTHDVYEPTEFSERLKTNGPVLIPPEGTGIGFDELLENLPWQELA